MPIRPAYTFIDRIERFNDRGGGGDDDGDDRCFRWPSPDELGQWQSVEQCCRHGSSRQCWCRWGSLVDA